MVDLTLTWSTVVVSLILACSVQCRVVDHDSRLPLSIVVKRQTLNETQEPEVSTTIFPPGESLLDHFSSSSKEKKLPKATMQSLHVFSNVTCRYAKTRIESKILNPAEVAQEVYFNVIIPETAFISGFSMEIDGKVYEAYVKEKEQAQQVYDMAVKQGVTAGHVKQSARDSNRFSVSVNVESQKKVKFNLTYEELLERKFGSYRHIINLNTEQLVDDVFVEITVQENREIKGFRVPDFQSGNEVYPVLDGKDFDQAVTERISPKEVKVTFRPSVEDQKKLRKIPTGDASGDLLPEGMNGQFAIEYDVERDPSGGEVLVNDGYFVHFFGPPDGTPLKKHVIFVLDVSGSMDGRKIEQLKQAMDSILGELRPHDFFNIIEFAFSVSVRDLDSPELTHVDNPWLVDQPYNVNTTVKKVKPFPATPEYIQKGKDVVKRMTAAGGTNIYDALSTALDVARSGVTSSIVKRAADGGEKEFKAPEPMIIFLTDGEPTVSITSDAKIIQMVDEKNTKLNAPIFSLAFGTDADFSLLKKLSLVSNAFARQIYEAADTSLQLTNFYKQISSPILSDVKFVYPPEEVRNETVTNVIFSNFFDGSELVVTGKLRGEEVPENFAVVEGRTEEGVKSFPVTHVHRSPSVLKTERNYRPLERLWVYMTIKQLLNEAELMKARSYLVDYKEEKKPLHIEPEEKALRLALEYSFVCPLTSLVVVKPGSLTNTDVESAAQPAPVPSGLFKLANAPAVLPLRFKVSPQMPQVVGSAFGSPGSIGTLGGGGHFMGPFGQPGIRTTPFYYSPPSTTSAPFIKDRTSPEFETLDAITWLGQVLTGDVMHFPGDTNSTDYHLGRNQTNEIYGNCTLPVDGSEGFCRHLEHCVTSAITGDVSSYYPNYFCLIPGNYAGVCCSV